MFATQAGVQVSDETISDLVRQLESIGQGSCRQVFDLGDAVLKVNLGAAHTLHGSCETEARHWEMVQGTPHEDLFAPVLASGDGWLIMVKADEVCGGSDDFHSVMRAANRLGITDLFCSNMGMFSGVAKVIDYATGHLHGGDYSYSYEEDPSPEPCECYSHTCEECYPHGCECCCSLHRGECSPCGEYEGCNTVECEECYEPATVHVEESGEWHGFKFGNIRPGWDYAGNRGYVGMVEAPGILHYCTTHAPETVSEAPTQCFGQRGWLIWSNQMLLPWEAK